MGRSAKEKTRKRAAPASKVLESITGSDALSILTVPTGLNGGCASCESESGEGMTPNIPIEGDWETFAGRVQRS